MDRKSRSKARKADREARKDPNSKYYRRKAGDDTPLPSRERLARYQEKKKEARSLIRRRLAGNATAQQLISEARPKVDDAHLQRQIQKSTRLPPEEIEKARQQETQSTRQAWQFLDEAESAIHIGGSYMHQLVGLTMDIYGVEGRRVDKEINRINRSQREHTRRNNETRAEIRAMQSELRQL